MNDSNGCTYFIQAKSGGDIKIGYTSKSDPIQRLRGIQTGNPKKLQIVGILRGNREAQLHAKFGDIRLEGEWFKPEQALVDFIEKNCSKELSSLLSHGITKPEHKSLIAHPRVTNVTTLNLSLSDGSKLHTLIIFLILWKATRGITSKKSFVASIWICGTTYRMVDGTLKQKKL